jgi:hypothetical protein
MKALFVFVAVAAFAIVIVHSARETTDRPAGAKSAAGSKFIASGKRAAVRVGWVGCSAIDDYRRVIQLAVRQRDVNAAAAYSSTHDCRPLNVGESGFVEDTSALSQAACVRPNGVPTCYWMPFDYLRQDDVANAEAPLQFAGRCRTFLDSFEQRARGMGAILPSVVFEKPVRTPSGNLRSEAKDGRGLNMQLRCRPNHTVEAFDVMAPTRPPFLIGLGSAAICAAATGLSFNDCSEIASELSRAATADLRAGGGGISERRPIGDGFEVQFTDGRDAGFSVGELSSAENSP